MIPSSQLWSGFPGGMALVLRGYIDESYSGERTPKMFSLTCTFAHTSEWPWIEMAWEKCIEEKNASLVSQGRKRIRRYHSVDINNFQEDFRDWDGTERKEFCEGLIRVFRRHNCGYEGLLINLQELAEEFPGAGPDYMAFAYSYLLKLLMGIIGRNMDRFLPGYKMTLFHERCAYDSVLLEAFNEMLRDSTFAYASHFTTIAPMGWEDCVPLQAADLLAYENFKEGFRKLADQKQRPRRKIFTEIISLDSFVANLRQIDRRKIIELRQIVETARRQQRTS